MSPTSHSDHTHFGLSVVVVGNDALIEALPARPIQFAHACRAAGFDMAFPASWGDELLAEATLRKLETSSGRPAVLCSCPMVRRRLLGSGQELSPLIVSTVAPSVAAGRYVRALLGPRLAFLAYVGSCPSASDKVFDAHYSPAEFLDRLREQRIDLLQQPEIFEAVLPPDRRRHVSLPGGCPTEEALALRSHERSLVSLEGDDIALELAQHLLTRQPVLVDLAPALGCACSGVTPRTLGNSARVAVMSLEPPRATSAVVDPTLTPSLDVPVEPSAEPPARESDQPDRDDPGLPQSRADRTVVGPPSIAGTSQDVAGMAPRTRFAVTPPRALPVSESEEPPRERSGDGSPAEPARSVVEAESPTVTVQSPEARERRRPPAPALTYVTRSTPGGFPKIAVETRPDEHLPRAYLARRPTHRRPDAENAKPVGEDAVAALEREVPVETVSAAPPPTLPRSESHVVPRSAPLLSPTSAPRGRSRATTSPPPPPPPRRPATPPERERRHVGWVVAGRVLLVLLLAILMLVALQLLAS